MADEFDNIPMEQVSIEMALNIQQGMRDVYTIYGIAKSMMGFLENIHIFGANLSQVLDTLLPVLRLVLFALKSAWDVVAILTNKIVKDTTKINVDSKRDAVVMKLADERKSHVALAKSLVIVGLCFSALVVGTTVRGCAVPMSMLSYVVWVTNDLVNYRYNMLKERVCRQDFLYKYKHSDEKLPEARESYQACVFTRYDKHIRLALNVIGMVALTAFFVPSTPLHLIAYAAFISLALVTLAYNKKFSKKVNAAVGRKLEKNHPLTMQEKAAAKEKKSALKPATNMKLSSMPMFFKAVKTQKASAARKSEVAEIQPAKPPASLVAC